MKTKKNLSVMLVNIHLWMAFIAVLPVTALAQTPPWSLQQCLDTAMMYNKNLQIGRNNIALGEEKKKEAQTNLLPKLQAVADYKYFTDLPYQLMPMSVFGGQEGQYKETQFGVPHNIGLNVQATAPLYAPQISGAIKTAKAASELNRLRFEKSAGQIIVEVSTLYYNAQILQHQLAFINNNLENSARLLDNIRLLYEVKMATGADVKKAELQKERLLTQRNLAVSQLEQTLNALKFSMGAPFEEEIRVESEIVRPEPPDYPVSPTIDQELAEAQTRLLTSDLKMLRKAGWPSLSLYGSYGTTGFGYDEAPNDFLKFYPSGFVGARIDVPLFNGTVNRRKITQKKIEIQNSEWQAGLVAGQDRMAITNAERQRSVMRQTIENADAQIELADAVYRQTILQQKEGTAAMNDVIIADNALREAQQSYLSAIVDYLKADLELKAATGNILNN